MPVGRRGVIDMLIVAGFLTSRLDFMGNNVCFLFPLCWKASGKGAKWPYTPSLSLQLGEGCGLLFFLELYRVRIWEMI
jgi:hypothetical protein